MAAPGSPSALRQGCRARMVPPLLTHPDFPLHSLYFSFISDFPQQIPHQCRLGFPQGYPIQPSGHPSAPGSVWVTKVPFSRDSATSLPPRPRGGSRARGAATSQPPALKNGEIRENLLGFATKNGTCGAGRCPVHQACPGSSAGLVFSPP